MSCLARNRWNSRMPNSYDVQILHMYKMLLRCHMTSKVMVECALLKCETSSNNKHRDHHRSVVWSRCALVMLMRNSWNFQDWWLHHQIYHHIPYTPYFSRGGGKPLAPKKIDNFLARQKRKRKLLRFFRRFKLNLRVCIASTECSSTNFRECRRRAACDVIFFRIQMWQVPPYPLRRRPWYGYHITA